MRKLVPAITVRNCLPLRCLPCASSLPVSINQESISKGADSVSKLTEIFLNPMQTKNRVPHASLLCIIISQGYPYKYFAGLVCLRIMNQSTLLRMLEVYFSSPKINKHPDKEGAEPLPNTVQYPSSV